MKIIRIPVHSIVDIITNSSTVVYVNSTSNTIDYTKKFLNQIIKSVGVDGDVDDYFDVTLELTESIALEWFENMDSGEIQELLEGYKKYKGVIYDDLKWEEQKTVLKDVSNRIMIGEIKKPDRWGLDREDRDQRELFIKPKKGVPINLTKQVHEIFELEGSYDG